MSLEWLWTAPMDQCKQKQSPACLIRRFCLAYGCFGLEGMEIYLFLVRVYNLWESHARSCQNYCEDFKRWRSPPTCDRTKGVLWCLVELVNTLTTQRNADTDTLIHVPIVPLILAIPSVSPWKQSRPICFNCRGFARL